MRLSHNGIDGYSVKHSKQYGNYRYHEVSKNKNIYHTNQNLIGLVYS